jgi:prolyl-tRNA editing enzyme YbaK/EbsC (Cys-tRNA(Pro) deacylase)
LPVYCDSRLAANERINFNAGDHSISVTMRYADYLQAEKPTLGAFTA